MHNAPNVPTITTHTTVGILNYKSTIHTTPVMSAPGAVVQWQLPQRGVHFTPFTPHLHPPVMSPRPCRGGRTRLPIHKTWGFSLEPTMTAMTFKCLLVMNEACLMELFKMMSTIDTYFICNKKLYECHIVNQSICCLCKILTCKFMQRWPTVWGELAQLHKIAVPINVRTYVAALPASPLLYYTLMYTWWPSRAQSCTHCTWSSHSPPSAQSHHTGNSAWRLPWSTCARGARREEEVRSHNAGRSNSGGSTIGPTCVNS